MAAYRRVYDSHYLQADCQERLVIEYGLPLSFTFTLIVVVTEKTASQAVCRRSGVEHSAHCLIYYTAVTSSTDARIGQPTNYR